MIGTRETEEERSRPGQRVADDRFRQDLGASAPRGRDARIWGEMQGAA